MRQLVFDKTAIKHNIDTVKKRAGSAIIYGVLEGDGYGAGLLELAGLLRDNGVTHYAVNEVADARRLRNNGFPEEEILMLRSTTDTEELEQLMDLNVICTIGSYETAVALNALAEERSTIAVAHILIDTGMGLGGFLPSEPEKLISIYKYLTNIAIAGTYTQLYAAGDDVNAQMSLFQNTLSSLHAQGLETGIAHAAGSSTLMRSEGVQLDAVRVGSACLGQCRRRKGDGLKRVCHAEATLDTVRWLPRGHTVGNHTQVRLKKPTRVAVISVGYLNGFGLEAEKGHGLFSALRAWRRRRRLSVRIGGEKAKIIGRIGAVETAIDVTDLKCSAGDVAVFHIDPLFAKGIRREYR